MNDDKKIENYRKIFELAKKIINENRKKPKKGKLNLLEKMNHSRRETYNNKIIAYLLDPNGEHNHPEFLLRFLEMLNVDINGFKKESSESQKIEKIRDTKITLERSIDGNRRIDIWIEWKDFVIAIESKIEAKEQENQLEDYYNFTKKYAKDFRLYFLTKEGNDARSFEKRSYPTNYPNYKPISWRSEIYRWLKYLRPYDDEGSLKSGLKQYIESIEIITNQTEEEIMTADEIYEKVLKDSALEIDEIEPIISALQKREMGIVYENIQSRFDKEKIENKILKEDAIKNLLDKKYFIYCFRVDITDELSIVGVLENMEHFYFGLRDRNYDKIVEIDEKENKKIDYDRCFKKYKEKYGIDFYDKYKNRYAYDALVYIEDNGSKVGWIRWANEDYPKTELKKLSEDMYEYYLHIKKVVEEEQSSNTNKKQ